MARKAYPLVIADSDSVSEALDRELLDEIASLSIPALDGDELAVEASGADTDASAPEDGDFVPLYNDNGEEVIIPVPETPSVIAFDKFIVTIAALRWVRFRARTAGTPEAQTADRTITVQGVTRPPR